jgi:hypothetical protein
VGDTAPGEVERRQAARILHVAPVRVEYQDGWTDGRTLNVSASGILFESARTFEPDQLLRFTLSLAHVDPQGALVLDCEARVVRVEPRGPRQAVALAITAYRFQR